MKKELLLEYARLLHEHFGSANLVNYFLAVSSSDDEIRKMMTYLYDHPKATATDMDEHLIALRI